MADEMNKEDRRKIPESDKRIYGKIPVIENYKPWQRGLAHRVK